MKFPPQTKPAAPGFCDLRQDRLLRVGVESGTGGGRGCSPRAAGGRPPPLPPTPAACSPLGLTPESFPADKGGRETAVVFVKRAVRVAVMRGPAPRGPGKPPRLAGLFFP